jgi:hypothetical protein
MEVQGYPNGAGAVKGTDMIDTLSLGPLPSLSALGPELSHQGRFRQGDELVQGGDAQALQTVDHEGIHGKNGNGAGGQKRGEVRVGNQNGPPRFSSGRRHPGSEFSGGPANTGGCYQGAGKKLEEGLKGYPYLPDGRTVKAFQTVHPHEDSPPAGRLYHRSKLHEGCHHGFVGRVIMGRIRFQERQGRAQRDGL